MKWKDGVIKVPLRIVVERKKGVSYVTLDVGTDVMFKRIRLFASSFEVWATSGTYDGAMFYLSEADLLTHIET
jgi:hypothetical protein